MMQNCSIMTDQDLIDALQNASHYAERGEWAFCLRLCRQLLEQDKNNSFANYLAGISSIQLDAQDDAISYLRSSIKIDETDTNKLSMLCDLLLQAGKNDEALPYLKLWANVKPTPDVLNRLGAIHAEAGRTGEAISFFRQSLDLQPKCNVASAGLYPLLRVTCEWGKELTKLSQDIDQLNEAAFAQDQAAPEPPFDNVHRVDNPKMNFLVARSWSSRLERGVDLSRHPRTGKYSTNMKHKIRIGYLSGDLHNHAMSHLMRGVFRTHERETFEICAYSHGPDKPSAYREDIRSNCHAFVDIRDKNDAEAAEIISNDNINILVDLMGYTRNNRLGIFAKRPAPIQITYLGFPGTTGADFFDYIVADPIVAPPDTARYFSESLVYLPGTYQANDNTQEKLFKKEHDSLKEKINFLFCSFNNPIKLDEKIFYIWIDLLKSIPDSGLWILQNNQKAVENLSRIAVNAGIERDRLIFAEMLPRPQHLQRMTVADLALDTHFYNGHTTTSDALWAGLPVVTIKGNHFASRVSASLLTAAGLSELVTESVDQYGALAYRLATNADELAAIRRKIIKNRTTCALFDTKLTTRSLEKAYREMWRRFVQNDPAVEIDVTNL